MKSEAEIRAQAFHEAANKADYELRTTRLPADLEQNDVPPHVYRAHVVGAIRSLAAPPVLSPEVIDSIEQGRADARVGNARSIEEIRYRSRLLAAQPALSIPMPSVASTSITCNEGNIERICDDCGVGYTQKDGHTCKVAQPPATVDAGQLEKIIAGLRKFPSGTSYAAQEIAFKCADELAALLPDASKGDK